MDSTAANAPRLKPDQPGYEAWFFTVSQPDAKRGFWFRYTRMLPQPGVNLEPHSAIWAFTFDRSDPSLNTASKDVYPFSALKFGQPFQISLGDGTLGLGGSRGRAGETTWDLTWEPVGEPAVFPFLKAPWRDLSLVGNQGAQLQLAVSGTIRVRDREHQLIGAPGGQQHTWGASHASSWNWGYASGPWGWIDGATSRVPSRFGRILAATAVGACVRGDTYRLNSLLGALRHPGQISPDEWRADIGRLRLSVVARPQDLIGVTYDDPTGTRRICYHTEVADLQLTLGQQIVRVEGGAAFEFASEEPLAGLAPILQPH